MKMGRVTRKELARGYAEMEDVLANGSAIRVSIYTMSAVLASKPENFGVSWPSIGTATPKDTRKFARLLLEAADEADAMEQEMKVRRMVYACYDCADGGMVVESSFLKEHSGHDLRLEARLGGVVQ